MAIQARKGTGNRIASRTGQPVADVIQSSVRAVETLLPRKHLTLLSKGMQHASQKLLPLIRCRRWTVPVVGMLRSLRRLPSWCLRTSGRSPHAVPGSSSVVICIAR